ncbi:MAG: hypothetical protein JWO38_982 [Gemmataceae bacterium]|nr:hypothetical protein [Gemmataceae bacterium]
MNESKWQGGVDGDAMLEFAADRLSARQWVLLSAAHVRRLWDLLPDGVLRQAVNAAELAETPLAEADRAEWVRGVAAATPEAVGAVELAQRELVKSADPDAADVEAPVLARPNQSAPAFPLFRAASTYARASIERIGEAMTGAAEAVRLLFGEPGEEMLDRVRAAADQAAETKLRAAQAMNDALRLKQEGDELADRAAAAKNKRLEEAKALEIVRKVEEGRQQGAGDWEAEERRDRAARKQLAKYLREVVGNPFTPPRFEPAWRTGTVVELARGIFADRAFDRLPILADALLDADCDEEAILRHCRGTEKDVKEPPQHIRGCWVVELALGRFEPLSLPDPGAKPRRRHLPDDFDLGLPGDDDDTAFV